MLEQKHNDRNMPTKRKDFTQVALDVVLRATGEVTAPAPSVKQESGRKGGLKGGASRASKTSNAKSKGSWIGSLTPAIAAGVATFQWTVEDIVLMADTVTFDRPK